MRVADLNEQELKQGTPPEASWHQDYADTAVVFVGGLPPQMTEGDLVVLFSQYGCPVYVKLGRDSITGKSRRFGYVKYEDQRSTVLAVDNFNGIDILGHVLRVDHARNVEQEPLSLQTLYDDDQISIRAGAPEKL